MLAFCIESSHQKGMGHLFRALSLIEMFKAQGHGIIVFVNNDEAACPLLRQRAVPFEIVDLLDLESDWESGLIARHRVRCWINDRLDTELKHAKHVKKQHVPLVTFDDRGGGSELADIHVAALSFDDKDRLKGKKVLAGMSYLVLNSEIARFRRMRTEIKNIIVTLGGSDTYGVTVKAVEILKKAGEKATIVVGPSFQHHGELKAVATEGYPVFRTVPSLIEFFQGFDLAITGGGITPFEANASGLPCIIIANELFEIPNGKALHALGSSVFAGHHTGIDEKVFFQDLDIERMSTIGMERIPLTGAQSIYNEISELISKTPAALGART